MGKPKRLPQEGDRVYLHAHANDTERGREYEFFDDGTTEWPSCSHIWTVMPVIGDQKNLLCYGIAWDLDYDKAIQKWKKNGVLDHTKIRAFLEKDYPLLARYCCTWTRSTGGKGLGVILWIEPFLYDDPRSVSVQHLASRVQQLARHVFTYHGMGADPSAGGVRRLTPNWRNKRKLLHMNEVGIRRVQRRERLNVLTNVYNELRRSSAFKQKTRSELVTEGLRFAVKDKTDEGLAKLYAEILNSEPETLSLQITWAELTDLTKLSEPTLRKSFKLSSWLRVTKVWSEGLVLKLKPTSELTERALASSHHNQQSKNTLDADWQLPQPEHVEDDYRNEFLWRSAVLLKWAGVPEADAQTRISTIAKLIPGYSSSRNCRNIPDIIRNIYKNKGGFCKDPSLVLPDFLTKNSNHCQAVNQKIFSLEGYAEHISIPNVHCSGESVCYSDPGEKRLENNVTQHGYGKFETIDIQEGEAGRLGDLPPENKPELQLLVEFAPEAARAIVGGRPDMLDVNRGCEKNDLLISSRIDQTVPTNTKRYRTLKAVRSAKFKDRHPLDRFESAFRRCLTTQSEMNIFNILQREELKMCSSNYKPLKGSFRRVLAAFAMLPRHIRLDLLNFSIERVEHGS